MKFPAPKTLTGAVSPMLVINWVFGIGVIEYPMGRPRRILSALWSIVNLMIYLAFLRMANFSGIAESRESIIDANNYQIGAYFSATYIVTASCLARIRAKAIAGTFLSLSEINGRLNILTIPNDYELLFKTQIIQLGIVFASISVLIVLDFLYVSFDLTEASRIGFLSTTHYGLMFSFFVNYTFIGSIRFQRLNEFLVKSDSLDRSESMITQSDNQFPHYSAVVREIHEHDSQSMGALKKQWLLYVVRETRKIHRDLCKTAAKLNRAFGMQVMLSVASSVNLITSILYKGYISVMASSRVDNFWARGIIAMMWNTAHAIGIILIVDTCEATSCEANRTGGLISKLLNTAAQDDDICDEINLFSLQLLQNPLNFTAIGFYPLSYSLIHGIIGLVATYLIIMIQMQNIYQRATNNATLNSTMQLM